MHMITRITLALGATAMLSACGGGLISSRERPDETKSNYAYMDQIAALRWVQQNIAASSPGMWRAMNSQPSETLETTV